MFLLSSLFDSFSQRNSQKKSDAPSDIPSDAKASKLAAAAMFGAGSLALPLALGTVGAAPALALREPDYFTCAEDMTAAGIASADAIAICASARYPQDVGACVVDISEFTGLTAASAAFVCGRSRRPIEVANCTIDIHEAFYQNPSTEVLNNCGRSLLPARYGACVVDLVDATAVAADEALTQCLRAGYRPWQIQPRS